MVTSRQNLHGSNHIAFHCDGTPPSGVFTPVGLFVGLFVHKQDKAKNYRMDYHDTWWKDVEWVRGEPIQIWWGEALGWGDPG